MVRRSPKALFLYFVASLAALFVISVTPLWAQHGSTGTVTVTVLDPSGGVVLGAQLELRDLTTNDAEGGDPGQGHVYLRQPVPGKVLPESDQGRLPYSGVHGSSGAGCPDDGHFSDSQGRSNN